MSQKPLRSVGLGRGAARGGATSRAAGDTTPVPDAVPSDSSAAPRLGEGREGMTPQEWVDFVYLVFAVGAALFMLWFARKLTKAKG